MNDLPKDPTETSKNPRRLLVAILIPLLGIAGYFLFMQDQHHPHEETLLAMTKSKAQFDSTLQDFPPFSEYYQQEYDPAMRSLVHEFLTTIAPPYQVMSWDEWSFWQKFYYEEEREGQQTDLVQLCDQGRAFCLGFLFDEENRLIDLTVTGFDYKISPKEGRQDSLRAIEECLRPYFEEKDSTFEDGVTYHFRPREDDLYNGAYYQGVVTKEGVERDLFYGFNCAIRPALIPNVFCKNEGLLVLRRGYGFNYRESISIDLTSKSLDMEKVEVTVSDAEEEWMFVQHPGNWEEVFGFSLDPDKTPYPNPYLIPPPNGKGKLTKVGYSSDGIVLEFGALDGDGNFRVAREDLIPRLGE